MARIMRAFLQHLCCASMLVAYVTGSLHGADGTPLAEYDTRNTASLRRLGALLSSTRCEHYSLAACRAQRVAEDDCPITVEQCNLKSAPGTRVGCMAVWKNGTSGFSLQLKSCWSYQVEQACLPGDSCVAAGRDLPPPDADDGRSPYFCCCTGDMCNVDIALALPRGRVDVLRPSGSKADYPLYEGHKAATLGDVISIVAPLCLLAAVVVAVYFIYRRYRVLSFERKQRQNDMAQLATAESILLSAAAGRFDDSAGTMKGLELETVVAKGRYGQVWRGHLSEQLVAVKVFPGADADSWVQEQEIYGVMGMREHPNIVTYIGSEVRGSPQLGHEQYWLVTAYMTNGALADYLKGHTVTLHEATRIAGDFLRGLAFLHDEIIEHHTGEVLKPTIVHRDFKSRNVLLDAQLGAKVADFGLAVKCDHGQMPADIRTQTGTRRYMAPEVLECYTEFSAFAFRQIDTYAAGLVLWEVTNRTHVGDTPADDYKLPFQDEVGLQPTLSEIKQCVCDRKQRPAIKPHWRMHKEASTLVRTMEEMWDRESEARLTAGCAYERLADVVRRLCDDAPNADQCDDGGEGEQQRRLVGAAPHRRPPLGLVESDDVRLPYSDECNEWTHGRDLTETV